MTDDPASRRKTARVDVSFKVQLQYPDRDTFVERFSINVSRTGLFVRARDPAPVGSRVHFEYRLQDDSRVLRGVGIVRWARTADRAKEPDEPPGMGIEFVDLDPSSEQLVSQIVATRGEGQRAPKKEPVRAKTASAPKSSSPGPKTLAEATLDVDEESALDALIGEATGTVQAPLPTVPARTTAAQPARTAARAPSTSGAAKPAAAPGPVAAPPAKPDPAVDPRPVVLLDLCGSDILGALAIVAGETIDRFEEQRLELRLDRGPEGLVPSPAGAWLPGLAAWAGSVARARAAARRLGLTLEPTASGELGLSLGGTTVSLSDLLLAAVQRAAAPFRDAMQDTRGCIVLVPASASPQLCDHITACLEGAGLTAPTLLSDAAAVLRSVGVTPDRSQHALVVQVALLEARATLMRGAKVLGTRTTPLGGFWDADRALAARAAVALNREHGIDVEDDASLREALLGEVRKVRQQHGGAEPWEVGVAGATVALPLADLARWAATSSEAVAFTAADVLADHGVAAGDLAATVLVTDEMPWPGLIDSFEAMAGVSPILPDAGPWIRIDGASRLG